VAASTDPRVRMVDLLLVPAFAGHALQLLREDKPWLDGAAIKYWTTPGWHLFLPPWVIVALAVVLAGCVVGLGLGRSRRWVVVVWLAYLAHYLTYPYRIRNHMTTLLLGLTVQAVPLLLAWRWGASDLRGRGPHTERVDRWIARGIAGVVVVTYLSAGLHKLNAAYLTPDPEVSPAARVARDFLYAGELTGYYPPRWVLVGAIGLSLASELLLPTAILLFERWQYLLVAALLLFHVPLVAAFNVSDYPMIASAFFPCLLTRRSWERLQARLVRPDLFTIGGALTGLGVQVWFMPWWGWMPAYGLMVVALWGWAIGAMVAVGYSRVRDRVAASHS